ncbi:MAG: hypothetical protein MUC88_27215 [Planctomycetes bacterium]|nr:hypothetical protein [Planctomycetota bacterium]
MDRPVKATFEGRTAEHKWSLKELDASLPVNWSDFNYLVLEIRTSTPQRFSLWLHTTNGKRRLMLQPFGQNVWLRASIPLQYFKGRDQKGSDMASASNRRTNSFWMSVWGPFGDLKNVQAVSVAMDYPLNRPTLEIRAVTLSKEDAGSEFIEPDKLPVLDEFGQWAHADWPRKIKSRAQLEKELADEEKSFGPGDFGFCQYGGYASTQAKATGFFRVEQIDGRWWFVDPDGHLFLSTGSNCLGPARRGGPRPGGRGTSRGEASPPAPRDPQASSLATRDRTVARMEAWGLTTIGNWSSLRPPENQRKAYVVTFSGPRTETSFLGMQDVYSNEFVARAETAASEQCAPRKDDPWLLGYFIGNEPPWPNRESEVVDLFLKGPDTATQRKLKEFLAQGDTPARRREFVHGMFERYLALVGQAIKKYDANHLNLGIRFGGTPPEPILRMAKVFDVCSINVYEYEPTRQMKHVYEVTGRPIVIGEFHFGVPADGLGAGLVQTASQAERAKGYRYYMEQAAALPGFVGAHWFQWRDEPVLGRMDGENYNIGFVDVTDRPYPEMVAAAQATHQRLLDVHAGKTPPFAERPRASDVGTPESPWSR